MGWYCSGFGWGGGWAGLLLNVVFFVGALSFLGLGIAWLVRRLGHRSLVQTVETEFLDIARRRLAAGEITVAEFEEIRDQL